MEQKAGLHAGLGPKRRPARGALEQEAGLHAGLGAKPDAKSAGLGAKHVGLGAKSGAKAIGLGAKAVGLGAKSGAKAVGLGAKNLVAEAKTELREQNSEWGAKLRVARQAGSKTRSCVSKN